MIEIRNTALAAMAAALLAAGPAAADCATDPEIRGYVEAWEARTPAPALGVDATREEALCTQEKLVAALSERLGPRIGYKAGLTSKAAQERFGASQPVRGVLLAGMLLEDGATVPAAFGARPLFEADMLFVIGDAAINDAETVEQVLAAVSGIRPFIELPDLAADPEAPITEATLTATNVAARLGVVGAVIPVKDGMAGDVDLAEALPAMTVRVENEAGEELAAAPGSTVLGHPAESVLWLLSEGITFEPGDVVSVGSIGPLMPPARAGGGARVVYEGLPGNPAVSVAFEER